jgi:hypothetical protein
MAWILTFFRRLAVATELRVHETSVPDATGVP